MCVLYGCGVCGICVLCVCCVSVISVWCVVWWYTFDSCGAMYRRGTCVGCVFGGVCIAHLCGVCLYHMCVAYVCGVCVLRVV